MFDFYPGAECSVHWLLLSFAAALASRARARADKRMAVVRRIVGRVRAWPRPALETQRVKIAMLPLAKAPAYPGRGAVALKGI